MGLHSNGGLAAFCRPSPPVEAEAALHDSEGAQPLRKSCADGIGGMNVCFSDIECLFGHFRLGFCGFVRIMLKNELNCITNS
jgi:hypothetical protein